MGTNRQQVKLRWAKEDRDRYRSRCSMLELAITLSHRSQPDIERSVTDEHDVTYTIKAYELHRADAGVVLVTSSCPGQSAHVSADLTLRWLRRVKEDGAAMKPSRFNNELLSIADEIEKLSNKKVVADVTLWGVK